MSKTSAPSGHFGTLPLEIQVDILLKLTASDLAAMESSSTHFRSVIVDGELWRRKADNLGLRVVRQMEKEISIMRENSEGEKDCMFWIHHDKFRFYTHTRVSSRYDPGRKVDCGMVVCQICLGKLQQMNKEFSCPKCGVKTVLEDWKASVQISIDKEVIKKVKLERILARKTEGKYKIKKILKFMMKEPPFPSMYWDMAIEEGMQEEEDNKPSEL
eukprot:GFUD01027650.1.p1 GENE.GFUD01027650.1~~GFUD01027650.1.p1  ORF type:complete len:215 (+),score=53.92 GFUD01027650.1:63-707(+)